MATTALAQGQLDMFAETDAAASVVAAAERQRIFDQAPSMFDGTARGFFARAQAAHAWAEKYGHFDCHARSHAWREESGGHGVGLDLDAATQVCRPATLTADLSCDHDRGDCCCVSGLLYRGACLHCDWEGEIGNGHNAAVEDAHDHAWPGWRDLPIVKSRPGPVNHRLISDALQRWVEGIDAVYPEGWLAAGGPIRTARTAHGTRHIPNYTGFGGYDLCGLIDADPLR